MPKTQIYELEDYKINTMTSVRELQRVFRHQAYPVHDAGSESYEGTGG